MTDEELQQISYEIIQMSSKLWLTFPSVSMVLSNLAIGIEAMRHLGDESILGRLSSASEEIVTPVRLKLLEIVAETKGRRN